MGGYIFHNAITWGDIYSIMLLHGGDIYSIMLLHGGDIYSIMLLHGGIYIP